LGTAWAGGGAGRAWAGGMGTARACTARAGARMERTCICTQSVCTQSICTLCGHAYVHKGAAGRLTTMVWGSMSLTPGAERVGKLRKLVGLQNAKTYVKVLAKAIKEPIYSAPHHFQQDNCPFHKGWRASNFLKREVLAKGVKVIKWPARSPDLSPIEFLWGAMERFMGDMKDKCKNDRHLDRIIGIAYRACSTPERLAEYRALATRNMVKCLNLDGGNRYTEH
jgi:hypothetical protein